MKLKTVKAYACFNGQVLVSASVRRVDACHAAEMVLGMPWSRLRGSIKMEKVLVVRGAWS